MKRAILVCVGCFLVVCAAAALAAEPVVCAVTPVATLSDGGLTSNSTAAPASGTCSWQPGATIGMQCDVNVYVDSQRVLATYSVLADAGLYYDGGTRGGAATTADQLVWFTYNPEPRYITLDVLDQHVSVMSQDGGTGTCKFMTTSRKR